MHSTLRQRGGPRTVRIIGLAAAGALVAGVVAAVPASADNNVNTPPRRNVTTIAGQAIDTTVDGAGNTYVSSFTDGSVTVFAKNANGAATPLRKIKGAATLLTSPEGVAVDGSGFLYVADTFSGNVQEYAPGATGNVAPANSFKPGLNPFGLALDRSGKIYVANGGNQIRVFSAAATGPAPTPLRTLTAGATGLVNALGLTVDKANNIWVANGLDNSVLAFDPTASGGDAPFRTIKGPNTGLSAPRGVTIDSKGRIYVSSANGNTVSVFAPGANGDVAPIKTLGGVATGLKAPWGVDLTASGDLLVVNSSPSSLSTFANLFPAATPPKPTVKTPSAPRGLAVKGKKKAKKRTIVWAAPSSNGGARITAYRVIVKKGSTTLVNRTVSGSARKVKVRKSQLRKGKNVVFVKAKNSKGYGPDAKKAFRVKK